MFTHRVAKAATRSSVRAGAAIILSLVGFTSGFAGNVVNLNCVRGAISFNCVAQWATAGDPYFRMVPDGLGEADRAQAAVRDRKWLARCQPVVTRDQYGVARYHYSAPDCEFRTGAD